MRLADRLRRLTHTQATKLYGRGLDAAPSAGTLAAVAVIAVVAAVGLASWRMIRRRPLRGAYRERIPGGRAAGRRPGDFDPRQLAMGIRIEAEHTPDRRLAREIAMDHLAEDPRYYTKLRRAGL